VRQRAKSRIERQVIVDQLDYPIEIGFAETRRYAHDDVRAYKKLHALVPWNVALLNSRIVSIVHRRRAKGVSFVELVKLLKSYRRKHSLGALSDEALELLEAHLLPTEWYAFSGVRELIQVSYRHLLGESEEAALQMGIAGGSYALTTYHKNFVKPNDPLASTLAMRHTWKLYFDFGELSATLDGDDAVRFVLEGYPDMTVAHGMMIIGWHRAAGLAAGAPKTRGTILEAPWKTASRRLIHRVEL
jgi:hypothetical protein